MSLRPGSTGSKNGIIQNIYNPPQVLGTFPIPCSKRGTTLYPCQPISMQSTPDSALLAKTIPHRADN